MQYHHLTHLTASAYRGLNRGDSTALGDVRRELDRVINVQPTQLHPEERAAFLETILDDLRPGSVWVNWPEDMHTQALVAVKVLGRNPVGSGEVLLQADTLATLVYHTCLAFPGRGRGSVLATSPPALEALRVIANTLVLHPIARKKLGRMGGAEAVARALGDELLPDRLFLICRVGFLITADGSGVQEIVDNEHIVPRIVYHLHANRPIPANYDALSELLKFAGNIIRSYKQPGSDDWDSILSPLLYPILSVVYNVPFSDLLPPLTHALHALLTIPFTVELLPTWYAVPTPPAEEKRKQTKGLFSVGRRKAASSKEAVSPAHSRRGSSQDALYAPLNMSRSPSPTPSEDGPRTCLTPRMRDPVALPRRLLSILTGFVDVHLPGKADPPPDIPSLDEMIPPVLLLAAHAAAGSPEMRSYLHDGLFPPDLDRSPERGPLETRPGLLGTLLRFMNSHVYTHCRDTAGELIWAVCDGDEGLVCDEIGYGIAAGLLFRKGISGPPPARIRPIESSRPTALNPVTSASVASPKLSPVTRVNGHMQTKSKGSSSSFASSLRASPPSSSGPRSPTSPFPKPIMHPLERHPITSLDARHDSSASPFDGMTEEEKEREAEKLFALFDRLERNPVLKAGAPTADGGTQTLKAAMAEKIAEGVGEEWERKNAEEELLEAEREADELEAEAMKELAEYKSRMGRR